MQVSNSEIGNFGQAQGNQGIARRRTYSTSHKKSRRLTPRSLKRAISGWKLNRREKELKHMKLKIIFMIALIFLIAECAHE